MFGPLFFLEFAYNEWLPTMCNISKFASKKPKLCPKFVFFFCHFLKLGSLAFFEIACSNSLQQCLTSCRRKFGPKLGPKLDFLPFSQVLFIGFS